MYIMAVLIMVKLYHNRHPDINATAYNTFAVIGVGIFAGKLPFICTGCRKNNLFSFAYVCSDDWYTKRKSMDMDSVCSYLHVLLYLYIVQNILYQLRDARF